MAQLGFWNLAQKEPTKLALVDPEGREWTRGEFLAESNRLTHGLRALGLEKGDCIADLIQLDGEGAFVDRHPLLAGTSGQVISRQIIKYVWADANVSKIVGSEILESRDGNLLSD